MGGYKKAMRNASGGLKKIASKKKGKKQREAEHIESRKILQRDQQQQEKASLSNIIT